MSAGLWNKVWVAVDGGGYGDFKVAEANDPISPGGFVGGDDLATAIINALFTNEQVPEWMVDSYNLTEADRQQWAGNMFGMEPGEVPLGSKLFLIERSPLTLETAILAVHYASLALQPLVRSKRVENFEITHSIDKSKGLLQLRIVAKGVNERTFFADLWPLQ